MMWLLIAALWLALGAILALLLSWCRYELRTDDETTVDRYQARRSALTRAQRRAVRR